MLLGTLFGCGLGPSVESEGLSEKVGPPSEGGPSAVVSTPALIDANLSYSSSPEQVLEQPLVLPPWMAKDLASSDVNVKLQALDRWAKRAPVGSVDPLLLALDDEDDRVQAKALALLEDDWRRLQKDER